MSQSPDMTREELQAHLKANEESVRRMTEGVSSKIDNLGDRIDLRIDGLEDKQTITRNIVIGVGTAILLAVISLFVYAMNRTDTVENRVFENTQRIEQVAPQSQGASSTEPVENSTKESGN